MENLENLSKEIKNPQGGFNMGKREEISRKEDHMENVENFLNEMQQTVIEIEKRMLCRGEEKRKQIVWEYDIKAIMHTTLLKGQILYSDANRPIKCQYYIFECIHKITKDKKIIVCGMGAARHFFKLTGDKPLPLFNMLRVWGNARGGNAGIRAAIQWNATSKQLYYAIMILIIAWDAKPGTTLYNLKIEAETHMFYPPDVNKIIWVNSIIAKDHKKRTLSEILNDLQIEGNDIREFRFNLLEEELERNHGISHF